MYCLHSPHRGAIEGHEKELIDLHGLFGADVVTKG